MGVPSVELGMPESNSETIFIGPRSDHSLRMSVTNSLTNNLVEDWMNWPTYAEYADYADQTDYADYAD